MTAKTFRRIALGMEGAVEGAHMSHPDFRANGKIFATIHPDNEQGMVKITPEQQERFVREHSGMFHPAAGAWGRAGATTVHLRAADKSTVRKALTAAWCNTAPQTLARQLEIPPL